MNSESKGSSKISVSQYGRNQGAYYTYLTFALVIGVLVMSCVAILGWIFHIPVMTSLIPNFIPMKANTAVMFLLVCVGLLLQFQCKHDQYAIMIGYVIGCAVFLYGVAVLLETHLHLNFNVDQIFIKEELATAIYAPGRPSPLTGIGFILIGISLSIFNIRLLQSIQSFIDVMIFFCGLLMLNSLSFDVNQNTQIVTYTSASIYTSISFLIIALALMMRKMDTGIMAVLTSYSGGGIVARNLFPAIVLIPIVFSFLRLYAEQNGLLDSITGHTLHTLFTIIVLFTISYFVSQQLMQSELVRNQIELDLMKMQERFQHAIETSPVGMAVLSSQGQFTEANQAFCKLMGFDHDDLMTKNINQIFPDYLLTHSSDDLSHHNATESSFHQFDEEYIRPDGKEIWLQVIFSTLKVNDAYPQDAYLIEIEDITLRKDYEVRIHDLAYHDVLTQLPNRRLLIDRLDQAITSAHRHHSTLAVLFIDLDNFKSVNDTFGHDIGDELIKALAVRLTALFRQEDTVAHISGDEFVVLLHSITNPQDAGLVAEKTLAQIRTVFLIYGYEINISASIGIALYPLNATTTAQLLKNADYAMYQAKYAGKNQYRYSK